MYELINRSKNGDEKAFTELILSIKVDLYKIAKTRLNDDSDINDAIQETIIKAYNHLRKLKNENKFKSWIIKILINECNVIYNKKSKKCRLINKIESEELLNSKEDTIQTSDSKIDFNILIDCLEYEEKIIITLFYNNKYTCSEIAEILNVNINTVKSKISRTKQKIRKYYKGGAFHE
ncbi:MAG: sigma-70 family RNA polymerase sigma factor [Clostridia bacterium]|nr:sigma-70 family RNA polymerase sigma factor [Clostridia bacterium]